MTALSSSAAAPAVLDGAPLASRLAAALRRWAKRRAAWAWFAPSALDERIRIARMSYGQLGLAARPGDLRVWLDPRSG